MRFKGMATYAFPILTLLFRLLLGALFLYAGIQKVIDPHAFAQAVYNYLLLPGWFITPVAIILPWIEIVVGVSLLLGIYAQGGALVASGLLSIFLFALVISLLRGLDISCGCFSTSSSAKSITWTYILRDIVLLGMGVHVILFQRTWRSLFKQANR